MTQAAAAVVRRQIIAQAPIERVFTVFTERFGDFKPPQRTRVELEHRNIDRHGPGWQAVRDGVADDAGWSLYLSRYAALFTEGN